MSDSHTISDVSRIAGIPKDLLRMWERRYNYPKPDRDNNGDRIYSNEQLDKLIAIRQLVDQGKRPGKLMGMDDNTMPHEFEATDINASEVFSILHQRTGPWAALAYFTDDISELEQEYLDYISHLAASDYGRGRGRGRGRR